jgi:hypothetical protein
MTVEELQAALEAGQTLAELAEAKGVDLGGFRGRPFGRGEAWFSGVLDELGLTFQDVREALTGGQSIADLAEEKGITLEEIESAVIESVTEHTQQAVDEGKLTQEEADEKIEQLQGKLPDILEGTGLPGPLGKRGAWGMDGGRALEFLAVELGIEVDDLQKALDEGKTIPEIAEDLGVELDGVFPGPGQRMPGFGGRRGMGGMPLASLTEVLGMTAEELQESLADGQTLADLAASRDVALADVVAALTEPLAERMQQAVQEGRLTQEEADAKIEEMQEDMLEQLESGSGLGMRGFGRGWHGHPFQRGGHADRETL